jgi:hypothetical protein
MIRPPSLLGTADTPSSFDRYTTDPRYFVSYDEVGPVPLSKALLEGSHIENSTQIQNILLHAFSHMTPGGCSNFGREFMPFSGGVMDILLCFESVQNYDQVKQVLDATIKGYSDFLNSEPTNGINEEIVNGYFSVLLQIKTLHHYLRTYKNNQKFAAELDGAIGKIAAVQRLAYSKFTDGYKIAYKNHIFDGNDPYRDYLSPIDRMKTSYRQALISGGFGHEVDSVQDAIESISRGLNLDQTTEIYKNNVLPIGQLPLAQIETVQTRPTLFDGVRKLAGLFGKSSKE